MIRKNTAADYLSNKEKKGAIDAAIAGDMKPAEIFTAILQNVYGITKRKELVIDWGKRIGLEPTEALRVAQAAHLIPSVRMPQSAENPEKPPRKTTVKTS